MNLDTHFSSGTLTALLLAPTFVDGVMIAFGSMFPDIDHGGTALGKSAPYISKFLEHRGFTHSLLFAGLMSLLNPWFGIGILVHIVFDMMTKRGVQLFYPWNKKIRFPLAKYAVTGGKFEKVVKVLLMILVIIVAGNKLAYMPIV